MAWTAEARRKDGTFLRTKSSTLRLVFSTSESRSERFFHRSLANRGRDARRCSVDFACYTRGSLEQLTVHEPGCFELRKKCGDLGVRCSDLSDKCAELGREYNVLHRRYKTLQEEHVTVCDEETTLRAEKDAAIKEVEELKIKLAEAHRTKRGSSPLELPPSKRVANEEDQALASLPSIEVLSYDAGSTTDHDKLAEMSNSVQQFLQGGASPPFAEP